MSWRPFLVGILYCVVAVPVQAAYTGPHTAFDAALHADAVFVGTAVSITRVLPEADEIDGSQAQERYLKVRFNVLGPLFYWNLPPTQVDVVTNASSIAFGFNFRVGRRYLVFAQRNQDGELLATQCSGTKNLKEALADLRYLRGLSHQKQMGEVRGQIVDGAAPDEGLTWAPNWVYPFAQMLLPPVLERTLLRGLQVQLTGGGESRTAITNGEGDFGFWGLPPGFYSVRLEDEDQRLDIFKPIHVLPGQSSPLQFHSYPPKVIRGVLRTAQGLPASGVPVDVGFGNGNLFQYGLVERLTSTITDKAGRFEFSNYIRQDKLLLGINVRSQPSIRAPYETWFYPGTTDSKSALVFDFADGHKTFDVQFKLPAPLRSNIVKILVMTPEGNPDTQAEVSVLETDTGLRRLLWCCTRSGPFAFWAFERHYYEVIGFGHDSKRVPCNSAPLTFRNSNSAPGEVKVQLTHNGPVIYRRSVNEMN